MLTSGMKEKSRVPLCIFSFFFWLGVGGLRVAIAPRRRGDRSSLSPPRGYVLKNCVTAVWIRIQIKCIWINNRKRLGY